jgi:hypothetical protein
LFLLFLVYMKLVWVPFWFHCSPFPVTFPSDA